MYRALSVAAFGLLTHLAMAEKSAKPLQVVTVCEVLADLGRFRGKSIALL
jgi:hypothetical protein